MWLVFRIDYLRSGAKLGHCDKWQILSVPYIIGLKQDFPGILKFFYRNKDVPVPQPTKNWNTFNQCCESRMFIPDPDFDFLPIPDLGVKTPGTRIRVRSTAFNYKFAKKFIELCQRGQNRSRIRIGRP